jgi:TolA-binding protein
MRRVVWLAVACAIAGTVCVAGEHFPAPMPLPGDRQLAFAEELSKSGDGPLAILERRRFVFMFPDDPRVPDARLAIARGYLEYTGDVPAARRELAVLAERYPNTRAAERAQELDALIEANKEMNYKPLLLFFGALSARDRGENAEALRRLDEMARSCSQAQLAPEAFLMRAQVLESERRLDDAIAAYAEVSARYPTSPLVPRALLGQATATEARDGAKPHVAELYRLVTQRYPNTPYAAQAQERFVAIRRGADRFERRCEAADVLQYRVLQVGYTGDPMCFGVVIEIPQDAREPQVKATLEDALIKEAGQRKAPEHSVLVTARFQQSRKKAGTVTWARDRKPDFDIERIKTRDKIHSILDDLRR